MTVTTSNRPTSFSTSKLQTPIVMRLAKPLQEDATIYDHAEKYDFSSQMLYEGEFFMGSPKKNTRCNRFTIVGADKTHQDDTKEK